MKGKKVEIGENVNNDNNEQVSQKSKGNYDVFEAIKHLEVETTYEKINEIIGFEGELTDQSKEGDFLKWKKYEWQLTDDTSIVVRLDEDTNKTTAQIFAEFPNDMIKNNKVDFSRTDEMKKKINSTEGLKYEEVVEILGGVEGTLDSVDSFSHEYIWVNTDGGTLNASFNKDDKCTIFNGVF